MVRFAEIRSEVILEAIFVVAVFTLKTVTSSVIFFDLLCKYFRSLVLV